MDSRFLPSDLMSPGHNTAFMYGVYVCTHEFLTNILPSNNHRIMFDFETVCVHLCALKCVDLKQEEVNLRDLEISF